MRFHNILWLVSPEPKETYCQVEDDESEMPESRILMIDFVNVKRGFEYIRILFCISCQFIIFA